MTTPPGQCDTCICEDCAAPRTDHADGTCHCPDCTAVPEYACTRFAPPYRITLIAEQLAPLLSTHLGEHARLRCLTAAHGAHHALHDHDHPGDPR